jgi:hypothetical protein
LIVFHRDEANDPTDAKAGWIIDQLYQMLDRKTGERRTYERAPVLKNIFRRDVYQRALALAQASADSPSVQREAEAATATRLACV